VTTIFLARHGESDWNVEKRFQGHRDRPLTERGREQAHALADLVGAEKINAVYTSPLSRARETAEIVAARVGLKVVALPELREVDTGSWSGLSRADVEARFPEGFAHWRSGGSAWENGESYDEMAERVIGALRKIGERPTHAARLTPVEDYTTSPTPTEPCSLAVRLVRRDHTGTTPRERSKARLGLVGICLKPRRRA